MHKSGTSVLAIICCVNRFIIFKDAFGNRLWDIFLCHQVIKKMSFYCFNLGELFQVFMLVFIFKSILLNLNFTDKEQFFKKNLKRFIVFALNCNYDCR